MFSEGSLPVKAECRVFTVKGLGEDLDRVSPRIGRCRIFNEKHFFLYGKRSTKGFPAQFPKTPKQRFQKTFLRKVSSKVAKIPEQTLRFAFRVAKCPSKFV